jgi:hypothetical protein
MFTRMAAITGVILLMALFGAVGKHTQQDNGSNNRTSQRDGNG